MASFLIEGSSHQSGMVASGLYIVATPIGNLDDITLRALKTLAGVDIVACEDTRTTGKLLSRYGIKAKLIAYHEHNAEKSGPKILAHLEKGGSVALVSDAGTPLVSDPGFRLVNQVRENKLRVIPIPGASSPLTALVASGLGTDGFMFEGFLPPKQVARKKRLMELSDIPTTLIFFESPKRLTPCLSDMIEIFGKERMGTVARELTKIHEEIITRSLGELLHEFESRNVRGEIVVLVSASMQPKEFDTDKLLRELMGTMSISRAAAEASALTGQPKRDMYQHALKIDGE